MVLGYGPAVGMGMSIISIVVVIILLASLFLTKKLRYVFNGVILLLMGILPMLYNARIISFNVESIPILKYVLILTITIAGKELAKEGFREQNKLVKYPSIALGIVIIIFTTVPALYSMGAIGFTIPYFPPAINYWLYIAAGILMFVGVFTLAKEGF